MNRIPKGKAPALVVLDLDWTTWQGDCDRNFRSPFHKFSDKVFDCWFREVKLFPDVREILAEFAAAGTKIAFASRNPSTADCEALLRAFGLFDMACVFLAHSSGGTDNKDPHFATIKERTGIEYRDMVFFDDGPGNIAGASALGVKSVLCQYPHGLTWAHVEQCYDLQGNTT